MERIEKERGDFTLVVLLVVMTGAGLAFLFSASYPWGAQHFADPLRVVKRQLVWAALGVAAGFVLSLTPLSFLRARMPLVLALTLVAMLLPFVPGIGLKLLGARRWILVFGQTFQPSEVAKAVLVLYLASYFGKRPELRTLSTLVPPLLVTFAFAALVLLQNDYSTAVFVIVVGVAVCWAAGARILHLGAVGILAVPLGALLLFTRENRVQRLLAFLGLASDPAGATWQIVNSHSAIVSGGIWGRGLGRSVAKLGTLPEAHSDFIFSVIGEETGVVGTLFVLGLFAILAWRGFSLAARLEDRHASLLAYGITLTIVLQALLNMAVAVGLLPTTGVTLPFFSAGGSSLLVTLALSGLLVNLSRLARAGVREVGRPVGV